MLTLSAMLALMLVYCTGCNPCARLARLCPPQESKIVTHYVHDTTTITKWQTDTAISLALANEIVRSMVLETDTAHAETTYAVAQAWYTGDAIALELYNKPVAPVYVPIYHEKEETIHEEGKNETNNNVQTVYKVPIIVECFAFCGLLCVI